MTQFFVVTTEKHDCNLCGKTIPEGSYVIKRARASREVGAGKKETYEHYPACPLPEPAEKKEDKHAN
jgi:hypothetical protein